MKNGRYHISFFKINLLKALATKNTLPPPPSPPLKSGWIISDPEQGGVRGGVIAVPMALRG